MFYFSQVLLLIVAVIASAASRINLRDTLESSIQPNNITDFDDKLCFFQPCWVSLPGLPTSSPAAPPATPQTVLCGTGVVNVPCLCGLDAMPCTSGEFCIFSTSTCSRVNCTDGDIATEFCRCNQALCTFGQQCNMGASTCRMHCDQTRPVPLHTECQCGSLPGLCRPPNVCVATTPPGECRLIGQCVHGPVTVPCNCAIPTRINNCYFGQTCDMMRNPPLCYREVVG